MLVDGTGEDGAYATRMDNWIAWDPRTQERLGMDNMISFSFSFLFVKGDPYPESRAQRTAGGDGFPLYTLGSDRREGRRWFPWCVWSAYHLGINDLSGNK